jgi:hypothetical protein
VIVLEKLHKDEAQRPELGSVQTQLERRMILKVRAPKSLNLKRGEIFDKNVSRKLPFGRITTRQHAATGDILLALAKSRRRATGEQSFTMNHNEAQRGIRKQKG